MPDHKSLLQSFWQELQYDYYFCDVTFICENKQVKAHKTVISSSSPILESILKQHSDPSPIIYLSGIRYTDFVSLLTFLYKGEVTVRREDLDNFLEAVKDFKVKGLSIKNESGTGIDEDFLSESDNNLNEDISKDFFPNLNNEILIKELDKERLHTYEYENNSKLNKSANDSIEIENTFTDETADNVDSTNVDLYFCDKCDYTAQKKKNLHSHVRAYHGGIHYTCSYCEYKATQKSKVQQHEKSRHEGIKYSCSICDYKTKQEIGLKKHMTKFHDGVSYSCETCGYKYPSKELLKQHNEGNRACQDCTFRTSSRNCKVIHRKNMHGYISKYFRSKMCVSSDVKINKLGNTDQIQNAKANPNNYSCNQCEFKGTVGGLKYHLQKHKGINFPCEFCGRKFVNSSHRKEHVQSVHEGIRYPCDQCDYKAPIKSYLRVHKENKH